jgi:hypothetical protein
MILFQQRGLFPVTLGAYQLEPKGYTFPAATVPATDSDLHRGQVLRLTFDVVKKAHHAVLAGVASGSHGTLLDVDQIWRLVYDETANAIRVVVVAAAGTPGASKLDGNQIIQDVFDPVLVALRVATGAAARTQGCGSDFNQIVRYLYIPADHALVIDTPEAGSGTYGTILADGNQAFRSALDRTTGMWKLVG